MGERQADPYRVGLVLLEGTDGLLDCRERNGRPRHDAADERDPVLAEQWRHRERRSGTGPETHQLAVQLLVGHVQGELDDQGLKAGDPLHRRLVEERSVGRDAEEALLVALPRRLQDLDGLRVEREGLWGFGYIDLRSIKTGPYGLGDQSIRIAGESMRRAGIPVLSDDLPETIQAGFPVTDAAAYYGWYSGSIDGPFAESSFRFLPGAVACHLHSFSASPLGDPAQGWTGPLVRHGAAASIGNVYEPYIGFTTNFGIFAWSLLAGHNLAESYYAAQPVLSWMTILVGDPLYRPYLGLSGQAGTSHTSPTAPGISETRSREWGKRQFDKWKDYRKIVLAHRGSTLEAASDLAHRARETHESLYLEGLGAAQSDAGQLTKAEASFNAAASLTKDPDTAFRILLERARTFEKEGKPARGAALLSKEISLARSDTQRALLDSWLTRMSKL